MSEESINNMEGDKRSTGQLHNERHLSNSSKNTAARTIDDHDSPTQMSQRSRQTSYRSKALGKRKREHEEEEAVDHPGKKPAAHNKECTVCLELVTRNSFPIIQHAVGGEHGSDVCLSCWDQHIGSEIRSKSFEGISCLQCSQRLVEEEVRNLTTSNTYTEYLDRGAKNCMRQDEEFQSCPSADCSWGAYFARDEGNIFNCQLCSLSWCLSCDIPFHRGETCEEHIAGERVAAKQRDLEEERERQLSVQRLRAEAGRASQRSIQRDLEEERERQRSIQRHRAEEEHERQSLIQRRAAEQERQRRPISQRRRAEEERRRQLLIHRRREQDERDRQFLRQLCAAEEEQQRQLPVQRRAVEEARERLASARRHEAEVASSNVTRVCPRCRVRIHRDGGCDHMTCRCGNEFCWLCLAPYLGRDGIHAMGNSAHQASCRHASRNLPDAPAGDAYEQFSDDDSVAWDSGEDEE